MYSVVKARYNRDKTFEIEQSNKLFIDGKPEKRYNPTWYELVERVEASENILKTLQETILEIEKNNHPWLIVPEKPVKKDDEGLFRLSVNDGWLEANAKRAWIQLDLDAELEDSGINSRPIEARLELAKRELPFLNGKRLVAHLSNKAFLRTYPDRLCLRIYLELSRPETLRDLTKAFKPYSTQRGGWIDTAMFAKASIHLVQAPECQGDVQREVKGSTLVYEEGEPFDLEILREGEDYVEEEERSNTFQDVLYGLPNFRTNVDDKDSELAKLLGLARSGWLNGRDGDRHEKLYKILQRAHWSRQNEEYIANIICENQELIGDHPEIWIHGKVKEVRRRHREYFRFDFNEGYFDKVFDDPKKEDLKEADLRSIYAELTDIVGMGGRFGLIVKSPYGSSKTETVIAGTIRALQEKKGQGKLRTLYISTLKSIVKGISKKLQFTCYISEGDVIDKQIILEADELGIGLRSLHHIEKPFDLVIVDESEQVGFWAHTFNPNGNQNHNILLDLMANATYGFIQMDADAAEMTFSMHDRAWKMHSFKKLLLENSMSWIAAQSQQLIWTEGPNHLIEIACQHIEKDRFHFMHTDMADRAGKMDLSALAKAVNDEFGMEKVKAFDDQTESGIKNLLTTRGDEYIPSLYDKGIRGIWVSPIIVSGWRYQGEPHFDATFGLYRNNFLTAPTIMQRIQRVPYVKEHYIYHSYQNSWEDPEDTRRAFLDDIDEIIQAGGDASIRRWNREHDKWELKAEAKAHHQKHLANVNLHLKIMWAELGGHQQYLEALQEDKDNWKTVQAYFADNKIELTRNKAEGIFRDPESHQRLASKFIDRDGRPLTKLEGIDQTIKLLEIIEADEIHWEQARDVLFLLSSEEDTWLEHAIAGWDDEPLKMSNLEIRKTTNEQHNSGFTKIGKLLLAVFEQLDLQGADNVMDYLWEHEELLIDVNSLDIKRFEEIRDLHKTHLKDWFNWFKQSMTVTNFLKNLFEKILQCDVTVYDTQSGKVVEAKKRLVEHYVKLNKMVLPKRNEAGRAYQQSRNILIRRLREGQELSEIEESYLKKTGGTIRVRRPEYYQKMRWNYVSGLMRGPREQRWNEIYEIRNF